MKGWDPVETPLQKDTSSTVEERANSSEELGPWPRGCGGLMDRLIGSAACCCFLADVGYIERYML